MKSLDELLSRKNVLPDVENSLLATLFPLQSEPSVVIYGPSKAGKTRLAAWEATAIASKLNRRVEFILTESNIEQEDIRDILAACIYNNVACTVTRFDHVLGLDRFIRNQENLVSKAIKNEDIDNIPRVYVFDSLTSLGILVMEKAPAGVVLEGGGSPTTLPYIYPALARIINPIRRMLSSSYLNGYMIMTAQEMQLRGETYVPGTGVKSKPRYIGVAQYNDDAEVYLGPPGSFPERNVCDDAKKMREVCRPLIVALSRRNPEYNGASLIFTFERSSEVVREGVLEISTDIGGKTFTYTPKDLASKASLADSISVSPLMPKIICKPK